MADDKKLTLFKNFFQGRQDIFPAYWQNQKGRSGYSPECANKFKPGLCSFPCEGCTNQNFVPLSDVAIKKHFAGGHLIGVYPLLQDGTCYFIAADFDDHSRDGRNNPLEDTKAFLEVCEVNDIPVCIERSKSGDGFHGWIFFKNPVPAWKARLVVRALLKEAQIIGDDTDQGSFDRLFPNQDKLSGKCLGNLIALPLYGKALKQGNSTFLDEDFNPVKDIVSFMESIRTVSEADLDRIINDWDLKEEETRGRVDYVPHEKLDPIEGLKVLEDSCKFIQHCRDNQPDIPEPLWYDLASNLGRFEGGRDKFHEFSWKHPEYSRKEADAKFDHAFTASGPITCAKIREHGFKCDMNCKVESPAGLANKRTIANRKNQARSGRIISQATAGEKIIEDWKEEIEQIKVYPDPVEAISQVRYFVITKLAHLDEMSVNRIVKKYLKKKFSLSADEIKGLLKTWKEERKGQEGTANKITTSDAGMLLKTESLKADSYKFVNYHCTDAGNAELFRDVVGKEFCHVPQKGCWFKFNGIKWCAADNEAKLTMLGIIRKRISVINLISTSIDNELRQKIIKWSLASESNNRLEAALKIAQAMLSKDYTEFDKDQFLLCVENGVIDLRIDAKGFRKARPEDYLHKCTNIKFDPLAECPRWIRFQNEITCNDQDMVKFKQMAYGYTLTGKTTEQCLFLCWGGGSNGKSTELGIFESLLGDYAISTPASTFKDLQKDDGIPNDIARMAGMRLVKTIEIKEGVRLNEERIKSLTGGDRISARFLHKEFFDYWPEYKLWMATNHKPIIKGTDDAIWRRIRLIHYEAKFDDENKDLNLSNTLQSELPGILRWAIEGCYFWQREGLEPIEKITKATNEYRKESDIIERFIYDRVKKIEGTTLKASLLYKAYKSWCDDSGEKATNSTIFGLRMSEKGYEKDKKGSYVVYYNIQLSI